MKPITKTTLLGVASTLALTVGGAAMVDAGPTSSFDRFGLISTDSDLTYAADGLLDGDYIGKQELAGLLDDDGAQEDGLIVIDDGAAMAGLALQSDAIDDDYVTAATIKFDGGYTLDYINAGSVTAMFDPDTDVGSVLAPDILAGNGTLAVPEAGLSEMLRAKLSVDDPIDATTEPLYAVVIARADDGATMMHTPGSV